MTSYFIITIFFAVILFDIFLKIKNKKTITEIMQGWYKSFIFVPFTVGVIFLGHFLNFIQIRKDLPWIIGGLCGFGIPMLIISIIFDKLKKNIQPWLIPIIILIGYLVGDIFF